MDLALIKLKLPSIQLCLIKAVSLSFHVSISLISLSPSFFSPVSSPAMPVSHFTAAHRAAASDCRALFPSQRLKVRTEQDSNMIVWRWTVPFLVPFLPTLSLTEGVGASTTSLLISALGGESLSRFNFSTEISLQSKEPVWILCFLH